MPALGVEEMSDCQDCGGKLIEDESKRHFIEGGRAGDTTYYYYSCAECDLDWTCIQDKGGLGGSGTFWHQGHRKD